MGECIVNEGETLIDSRVNNSSTCIRTESVMEFPEKLVLALLSHIPTEQLT